MVWWAMFTYWVIINKVYPNNFAWDEWLVISLLVLFSPTIPLVGLFVKVVDWYYS